MVSTRHGFKMGIRRNDYRKLLSVLCREEKDRKKKIKFVMTSKLENPRGWFEKKNAVKDGHKYHNYMRKLGMDKFIDESFLRSNEVSLHNIETYMETSTRILNENQGRHHVVADYLNLFDLYNTKPARFLKIFSSALNNLKCHVLDTVAHLVTENKILFRRTRASMKRIIEENLLKFLLESDSQNHTHSEIIKKLSLILRDPFNFRKYLRVVTLVTPLLLSSIKKILDELETIPIYCLLAMDRKINNERVIPELLITAPPFKKSVLRKRIRKKFNKILKELKEGDELPEPLGKALSVITLHKKLMARQVNMFSTEFFSVTPHVEAMQTSILKALWLLPQVKRKNLKTLKDLLDPKSQYPRKPKKNEINLYLMKYLFECCEIGVQIPKSIFTVIDFIKSKYFHGIDFCENQGIEEEREAILSLSTQFKQIAQDSFHNHGIVVNEYDTDVDDADVDVDDDILIDNNNNDKSYIFDEFSILQYATFLDNEKEGVGETEVADLFATNSHNKFRQPSTNMLNEADSQTIRHKMNDSIGVDHDKIQSICDETSLLAHCIVNRLVEESKEFETDGDSISTFLVKTVSELAPTLPKSYLGSIQDFMDATHFI